MVRRAEAVGEGWADGQELDVRAEMAGLTLAVVAETLFGAELDASRRAVVTRSLTDALAMFELVYSPLFRLRVRLPTPTMRRFRRIERRLDDVVASLVAERRGAGAHGGDVLSLLLRAEADGVPLSDREVRDEALTLVLAGHETTANALAWTWWLLSEHPDVEARLHAELDDVLGGRAPTAEDLPRLRYTEMVLAESIRLRPPAWAIGRRAVRDARIGDVDVPAGSVAVVSPWLLHHDARWWPQPDAFRPERWAHEQGAARPRSAYLPFGAGPRMCVGEPFARMEGALVLATLASRWRFRLRAGHTVRPQAVITLRPRGGLPMVASCREASVSPGERPAGGARRP
jgi:cytochrome P450